ncbi:MAG: hypothetical protein RMK91_06310 [Pseudanabaenaceae cyanobacterium SKYGB_i_bin29]|nr:hypothetical protein [Pseudanabaenaceae cyanobacterium SKYG29]MDW8421464.1 hypothetical protein [Pseudanabaenaceae cyanobacterium SKYGB_i_bin29]
MVKVTRKTGEISFTTAPPLFLILFMLVWGIGFIGMPLFMIGMSLSRLGITKFTCQKIEPRLADCQLSMTPRLSIFPVSVQEYKGVKGAKYVEETRRDSEGDEYKVYFVELQKVGGVEKLRMSYELAAQIPPRLDTFLKSQEETFTLTEERNFDPLFLLSILFPGLFIVIGVSAVAAFLWVEKLSINSNFGQVSYLRIGIPLFRRIYSFNEIQSVRIDTVRDEDSTIYKVQILPCKGKPIEVDSTTDRDEAIGLLREVGSMIGCPQIEPEKEEKD